MNQANPVIYVSNITIDLGAKGPFYQARAHVVIQDDSGNIVKNAGVQGRWLKNGSLINEASAATNGVGEARLDSDKFEARANDKLSFEVVSVFKEGYTYDSNANIASDGFVEITR